MKFIVTILYIALLSTANGQSIVVKDTLVVGLGEVLAGNIAPIAVDDEMEVPFKKGTAFYSSKSYTVVKVTKDPTSETFFVLKPLKVGKSLITIRLTLTDGRIITKTFVCVITQKQVGIKVQFLKLI